MSSNSEFIRTVCGDIPPSALGHAQCHEHIYLRKGPGYRINPALCMDDDNRSLRELLDYQSAGGSKKQKKLFIDRKIPAARRERIPVLADETGILGIYSIGVNQDRKAAQLPAVRIRITETEYSEEQDYGKRYPEGIDY